MGLMFVCLPALAETWATGDCTTSTGSKIIYLVDAGQGFIKYGSEGPYPIFTKKEGDIAIITHIANAGNMVMAINLNTGRGYLVTNHDDGTKVEKNVFCKLSSMNK
jgi:hypothetical protein